MESRYAENEFIQLWNEQEILFAEYKKEITMDLSIAKEVMDLFDTFCGSNRYYVIQDINNLNWIDKQSRDYIATHVVTNRMKGWAYLSRQPIHQIITYVYLTFSKPEVRTNIFTTREEALTWLQKDN